MAQSPLLTLCFDQNGIKVEKARKNIKKERIFFEKDIDSDDNI